MNLRICTTAGLCWVVAVVLGVAQGPPMPLPPVPVPPGNPLTPEKIVLGKILFWDEQLSSDNTVACGTCHLPEFGGADPRNAVNPGPDNAFGTGDDKFGSFGVVDSDASDSYVPNPVFGFDRQVTGRSAPSAVGAAHATRLFWDGRAGPAFLDPVTLAVLIPNGGALEAQAVGPILSSVEMAHQGRNWTEVVDKLAISKPLRLASNLTPDIIAALAVDATYPALFARAFGTPDITPARIGMAIASYERILEPDQTPFDQFAAGNPAAMTPQQHQGFMLFNSPQGQCNVCHPAPLFTNNGFRNIGLRPISEDAGRFDVTGNPNDLGRFRVPPLRNVGLKSRFMHNGEHTSLAQVMAFYNDPGNNTQNRDPSMDAIDLTPAEVALVIDFMANALTDPRVAAGLPPFDRPTLRSELASPPNPVLGVGGPGASGIIPDLLATVPANLGNGDFKVGLGNALGGGGGWFALSTLPALPGVSLLGAPVHVELLDPALNLIPFVAAGTGPGAGYTTLHLPIPDAPALTGFTVYGQWFVIDPLAPQGVASTAGGQFTLF